MVAAIVAVVRALAAAGGGGVAAELMIDAKPLQRESRLGQGAVAWSRERHQR